MQTPKVLLELALTDLVLALALASKLGLVSALMISVGVDLIPRVTPKLALAHTTAQIPATALSMSRGLGQMLVLKHALVPTPKLASPRL